MPLSHKNPCIRRMSPMHESDEWNIRRAAVSGLHSLVPGMYYRNEFVFPLCGFSLSLFCNYYRNVVHWEKRPPRRVHYFLTGSCHIST